MKAKRINGPLLVCTLWLITISSCLMGQNPQPGDSLYVPAWSKLVLKDTSVILKRDTVFYSLPEGFIEIKKRWFARFFHNAILVDSPIIERPERSISDKLIDGRKVDTTVLVKLDALGTNILDPEYKNDNFLTRIGNKMYIKTTDFFIRNNLLYEKLERIDKYSLDDTERHLRSFPFIKDARIDAIISPYDSTKIEVISITRDVWPYRPSFRFKGVNQGDVSLEYLNVAGLGHSAFGRVIYAKGAKPQYEFAYQIPNVFSSINVASFEWIQRDNLYFIGGSFTREYLYPEQKYAGGFSLNTAELPDLNYNEESIDTAFLGITQPDLWVSMSFPANIHFGFPKARSNIITGMRLIRNNFYKLDGLEVEEFPHYQDAYILVGSVSLHNRTYYKDNLLLGFGRTEDVPQGQKLTLTMGYEFGELSNRPYTGISLRNARYWKNFGYADTEISLGSFWSDGKTDQGAISARFTYFTPLFGKKRFLYRYNFQTLFQLGIRLPPNQIIDITDRNGLRGLDTRQILGQNGLNFNNTIIAYTPWQPFGFRCALVGFFDVGFVSRETKSIFDDKPIYGIGAGVQFNNENFIIGTILVGLAYYVNDPNGNTFTTFASTRGQAFFENLEGRKPRILSFRDIE